MRTGPRTLRSARLDAIAALVLPGKPVAEIGADCAKLSRALVTSGRCPRAVAGDVSPSAVAGARRAVSAAGLESSVRVIEADGLRALEGCHAATVVLAGLGGHRITGILDAGEAALERVERLVLSPHRDAERVRAWLRARGWTLVREQAVVAGRRAYLVFAADAERGCTRAG